MWPIYYRQDCWEIQYVGQVLALQHIQVTLGVFINYTLVIFINYKHINFLHSIKQLFYVPEFQKCYQNIKKYT